MSRMTLGRPLSLPTVDRHALLTLAPGSEWLAASTLSANGSISIPATPHTASGWSEVVAATTTAITALYVRVDSFTQSASNDSSALLDIGIGPAGSETVLVPYLAAGYHYLDDRVFVIPVSVPVGSRLSIRCQSALTSGAIAVTLRGVDQPGYRQPPTQYATSLALGVNTAASQGTVLTAPASTGIKSAWTELSASCPQHLAGIIVNVQAGSDTSLHASGVMVDIGIGSAGSETVIVPNIAYYGNTQESMDARMPVVWSANIPAGTRIAARWQRNNANNSIDCHLLGIPA